MEIIFFLGIVALIIALICFDAVVLRFFLKKFTNTIMSFGEVILFLIFWSLVASIVSLSIYYFVPEIPTFLLNLIVGFGAFYYLLNRRNSTSYIEALKVYVSFVVVAVVVSVLIVVLIRGLLFTPFVVVGQAMNPTFQKGDYLIVDLFSKSYERGDVVVYEGKEGKYFVHRIIGLPNERIDIRDSVVMIDGQKLDEPYANGVTEWEDGSVELGHDEYFIMGDNRERSNDSRFTGAISTDKIFGEYLMKIDLLSTSDWIE